MAAVSERQVSIISRLDELKLLSSLPEELEEYLLSIPEVEDAIVYAKKDTADVLRLYATLLPTEETKDGKSDEELLALLKERVAELNHRLPAFKRISDVSLTASPLPRNGAGKLLRDFVG